MNVCQAKYLNKSYDIDSDILEILKTKKTASSELISFIIEKPNFYVLKRLNALRKHNLIRVRTAVPVQYFELKEKKLGDV